MSSPDRPADGADSSESLRLFIAVAIPPAIRRGLTDLRPRLEQAGAPATLRWVRSEGIHLTLKFLGATPVTQLATITDAIEETAAKSPAHHLQIDGLGLFGGRRPRVLWAGLGGDTDIVRQCAARLDGSLAQRGFPADRQPFAPHLTLARLRDRVTRQDREALRQAVQRVIADGWMAPPSAVIAVTTLHLIRSQLGPDGSCYESLASAPLLGAPDHN